MAQGGGKRKRGERPYPNDDGQGRPSPHRPESLNLAQQNQRHDRRGGGRPSRGGQGGQFTQSTTHGGAPFPSTGNARDASNGRSASSTAEEPQHDQVARPETPVARPRPVYNSPVVPPPSPPRGPPAPYVYEYVTGDIVLAWQRMGKQAIVDKLSQSGDDTMSAVCIQELFRSMLDGRLDPTEASSAFKISAAAQDGQAAQHLHPLLIDTVAMLSELDLRRQATRSFVADSGVPAGLWREQLDVETLIELGLVRKQNFGQIKIRKQTNFLYRQANYNLLREESEGYAKLITESFNTAMTAGASDSAPTIAEDAFQRVKALVGSFDLDVGRVLDITLDVFANLLVRNFRFFVKYIRASSWWPEDSIPEGIQWETQGYDSLPGWALPGSGDWGLGPEETERVARLRPLKEVRDETFWRSVREKGMDAFYEIGARRITNYESITDLLTTEIQPELDARGAEQDIIKRKRLNNARNWMHDTRTLPPLGNADAAQLLGFKLRFYSSPARDKQDVMPENLIYLTALLIKIGFISIRDIYPHLYPSDDLMGEVKERLTKEQEERERASRPGGAAKNALAMAGALADDTVPAVRSLREAGTSTKAGSPKPEGSSTPSRAAEESRDRLSEPPDQKILLLKSLLAIGAIPEALFILGRFSWLADLVPDLPEHIHRILHHMIGEVYERTRPLSGRQDLSHQKDYIGDPSAVAKGSINHVPAAPRVTKRWANLDRADLGDGAAFKFYWDDWADNVPICKTVDDVFLLCGTFLNLSGVKIGKDPSLLSKIARIGKQSLRDDRSQANESRWIDLLKRLLVPALSLTSKSPGLVNEVYDVLKLFPTDIRYAVYAEWHFGPTSRLPAIKGAFEHTRAEAKDVLKRISKTNVRAMGKQLAKVAYSSPGIVLQTAINQMESYENLIEVFVECSRYFTYLGYDVLTWCLLNALGGAGRNRIQADGMLTSSWLRALSTFAGAIFKRYSTTDPSPILQYIASELRNGRSADLEILEQIVAGMAGIKSDMMYNDAQVLAMAGGEILQSQTIIGMADERHKHERSSKRLMKSLTEPGLAGQLLISIAQEWQMYAHHESSKYAPLKVLGNNLDKIHQVFAQFLDTLRFNLPPQEFQSAVPDIASLIRDFGLEPAVAFMIGRSTVATAVAQADAARKLEQQEKARRLSLGKLQANGDTTMTDTAETPLNDVKGEDAPAESQGEVMITNGTKPSETDMEKQDMLAVQDAQPSDDTPLPSTAPTSTPAPHAKDQYWHPALTDLIERIKDVMGSDFEASMSVPFYVTFWTLALQDILVNTNSYDQELANQSHIITQTKNDRSDLTSSGAREKEKKIKGIVELKERLTQEMKAQIGAYTQVRNRLSKEKDHWFLDFHGKVDLLHTSILQNCFLPRILLSPLDAHYTFMMLKFLHNSGSPGFRTMHLIDRLLRKNQIAAIVFECTAREVENFGRFLNEVLKELQGWHGDKVTYEKNAFGAKRQLSGFARKMTAEQTPETFLEYEDYRRLLFKWHASITNALKHCFDSGEYMHIRNTIIVLKAVHQNFPVLNFQGTEIVGKVEGLIAKEKRDDLKLAARSLLGDLKKREKSWLIPQAFRLSETLGPGAKGRPSRSTTPQPQGTPTSKLNAAAPDFQPSISPITNGDAQNTQVVVNGDAEDGEIDDAKKAQDSQSVSESAAAKQTATAASEKPSEAPSRPGSTRPIQILKRPQAEPPKEFSMATSATTTTANRPFNSTENSRQNSTQPPQNRHVLPARPEALRSDSRSTSRAHAELPSSRSSAAPPPRQDSRDRRTHENYGRLDSQNDVGRASFTPQEQHAGHRSRPRTPERDLATDRREARFGPVRADDHTSARPPPHQDARPYERDAAAPPRGRESDHRYPSGPRVEESRRTEMPPPAGAAHQSDKFGPPRPEQAPRHVTQPSRTLSNGPAANATHPQEGPGGENPARFALIRGHAAEPTSRPPYDSSRTSQNDRRERSPIRADERSAPPPQTLRQDQYRERSDYAGPPRPTTGPETRREHPSDQAPTGPRNDRSDAFDNSARAPPRELFESRPARVQEPSHGRLNPVPGSISQQESTYGRLNAAPEVPSGPRSRNAPPLQSRANGRENENLQHAPSSPVSSRSIPTGPSDRRQSGPSMPTTPVIEQVEAVHPSRLQNVRPSVLQTSNIPVSSTPRSAGGPPVGTPTGPSPSNKAPPSGPSSAGGGTGAGGRSRNTKLLAGLNDALRGGEDRGASIRGRAGRPNGPMIPPTGPASSQQTPAPLAQPQRDVLPASGGPIVNAQRASLIADRGPSASHGPAPSNSNDMRLAGRQEDIRNNDRRQPSRNASRERDVRHENDRRNDHRGGEPDSRSNRGAPREEYRDRRDGPSRHDGPSGHGPPVSMYPAQPGPDLRGYQSTPDQYGSRGRGPMEESYGPPRADGRPRDEYRAGDGRGGHGRSEMPPYERGYEGRDDRGRDGRKRRGDGMAPHIDPKRRRSGM